MTINPDPTATSLTPSNTVLDSGQYETYNVLITGGTSPFTANLIYVNGPGTVNSITAGNVVETLTGQSDGTITFPSFNSFSAAGSYTFNVVATDSANTPVAFNSISNTITVSSSLSPTSISSPTSGETLDSGQSYTISVTPPTTGTSPYTYSWAVTSGYTCPGFTSADTASFTYTSSTATSASCEFTVTVTDSASTHESYTATTLKIVVNPALAISLSPSSNTLDANQQLPLTATVSGGTPIFALTYTTSNSICGSLSATSNSLSADGVNTIVFTANSALTSRCVTTITTSVIDSAPLRVTANTISSLIINSAPTATLLTPSNTVLDSGQYETYNVLITGGTFGYKANLIYVSGPSGATVNGVTAGNIAENYTTPQPDGTITFPSFNSFSAAGSYTFNVVATDSANTPVAFNSIANSITVNPAPTATSLTPSNTAINPDQYVTYNVVISGGTLPITADLVLVSNSLPLQINGANAISGTTYNTIVLNIGSAEPNTITFNSLELNTSSTSSGSVVFAVNVVDSASSPFTFNSESDTVTIFIPSHSGGGGPAKYTFTLSDNINSTLVSAQPVYTLYTSNGSISYYQNQLPLTLSLLMPYMNVSWACSVSIGASTYAYQNDVYGIGVGIPCGKYYTTYIRSIESIYSISAPAKVNTTTVSTTTSTTTTIPPTITILPVNRSVTVSGNVSSSSPLRINFTDMHVSVVLTTPSLALVPVLANITNETSMVLPSLANYTLISVLNVSVATTANVSAEVTSPYPCAINSSLIKPFELVNGSWAAIIPFSVNASACTVSFVVSKDPIVGIFQKIVPTATTTATTTIIANTTTVPIITAPSPPLKSSIALIIVTAAIIIILFLLMLKYYLRKIRRAKGKFKLR